MGLHPTYSYVPSPNCHLFSSSLPEEGPEVNLWAGYQGRARGYSPLPEHASPRRKVKSDFFGDFWHLQYPENHISAPSSGESAPRQKIPGATHAFGGIIVFFHARSPPLTRSIPGPCMLVKTAFISRAFYFS